MRCRCGADNPEGRITCRVCGARLSPEDGKGRIHSPHRSSSTEIPYAPSVSRHGSVSSLGIRGITQPTEPDQFEGQAKRSSALHGRVLEGEILHVSEPPEKEPPDRDWYMGVTRLLWFLGLVFFPVLALYSVYIHVGPVAAIVILFLFFLIVSRIGIGNIFYFVGLLSLFGLWPHREREQVPVYYVEVRESSTGQRRAAVLKGRLTRAHLRTGQRVLLRGRYRDDVFFIRSGEITSMAGRPRISRRENYSWLWLLITIIVFVVIISNSYDMIERMYQSLQAYSH